MHLLKKSSKPTVTGKKKKKYSILGSLSEYKSAAASKSRQSTSSLIQEPTISVPALDDAPMDNVQMRRGKK